MKKFDKILICTDLDGTLLRNDKTISPENLSAIEYFKSEGGLFTFITGRMPFFASDICDIIKPNAPFGCINGGGIYDYAAQKYLWTQSLTPDVLDLVEYVDKNLPFMGIQVNTFEKIYFCKENAAMAEFRAATKQPNITCHYREVNEPIAKILFGDQSDHHILCLKDLLDHHPNADNFDFIRSEFTLYEILPKGISKGSVLPKLVQLLNIDPNKTIAVGDYNNDIAMLRASKTGIAVANALPEVKAAADYITVSNEEHAIAAIISDIENGKLQI